MKTTNQPSNNSTLKKILIICGIIVGVIILLVASVLLYSTHAIRKFKKEYTEDKPVEIQHEPITKKQQTQLTAKYNTVKEVLKTHKKTEIQFTSEEFSHLMAYSPETKGIASKSRFWLEGDKIKAELSIPLNSVPKMQGRYLNGIFTFSAIMQDGRMRLHVDEGLARGRPISQTYLNLLNSQNLEGLLSQHSGTNWSEFIENLEINDGKLTIKTR
ncbi:MAG: hypothetical protein IKP00_08140 [Victivallales bacterium]|nr:hypothetical protein [Victivallales bacterium]